MTDHGTTSTTGRAFAGPDGGLASCPGCGAAPLDCVTDGELTNFFCGACRRCWHLELGWAHRIDPATCPGCQVQNLCLAGWGRPEHREP